VPVVDLDVIEIPQAVIDLIPGDLCESWGVVPFAQPMKFLDLAMSDPSNLRILDELRRAHQPQRAQPPGRGPRPSSAALGRYYGRGMGRAAGAGRRRETLDVPRAADEEMELVNPYDPAASRSVPVAGNPPSTQSRERFPAPPPPARTGAASTAPAARRPARRRPRPLLRRSRRAAGAHRLPRGPGPPRRGRPQEAHGPAHREGRRHPRRDPRPPPLIVASRRRR
jgi:hypothetical protein